MENRKVWGFISGPMEIVTRGTSKKALSMVKVPKDIPLETSTEDISKKVKNMAMGSTTGSKAVVIKGISERVLDTAKDIGKAQQETVTMVNTKKGRNMELGSIHGPMELSITDIFNRIYDMDMGRSFGRMEAIIKEIGSKENKVQKENFSSKIKNKKQEKIIKDYSKHIK